MAHKTTVLVNSSVKILGTKIVNALSLRNLKN